MRGRAVVLALWLAAGGAPGARAESVQDLIDDLESGDVETQLEAAQALARLAAKERHPEAVVPLARALGSKSKELRSCAAGALCRHAEGLDSPPKELIPALVCGLKDPEVEVCDLCLVALVGLGRAGERAAFRLLADRDDGLKAQGARALARMAALGRRSPEAVAPLVKAMGSKDGEVRRRSAGALSSYAVPGKELPKELLSALFKGLEDPEEGVWGPCAGALATGRAQAVPGLLQLLGGKDVTLQARAAYVLGSMAASGYRPREAVPALERALRSGDAGVRRHARYALHYMDPRPVVVPARP